MIFEPPATPDPELSVVSSSSRAAYASLACLVLVLVGCAKDEPTPEEARYNRVRERLERSFTDEQAGCMLDEFDENLLVALDAEGQVPAGPALEAFSAIAQTCVMNGEMTTTTVAPGSSTEPAETDDTAPTTDSTPTSAATNDTRPEPTVETEPDAETPGEGDSTAPSEPEAAAAPGN